MRRVRTYTFICEYCSKVNERTDRNKPGRFCNRSCSNAWQHAHGIRRTYCADKTLLEWQIQKFGFEHIERLKEERQKANLRSYKCEQCNQQFARRSARKFRFCCKRCANAWTFAHGRKMPNSLGSKHSMETRIKMSESAIKRLQDHPDTNHSYGIKGWYKGIFFRSSYEYFFMKRLEREGVSLRDDVSVEPFRIRYEFDNVEKHYVPDFLVKSRNVLYEVKSSYSKQGNENEAKFHAAIEFCSQRGMTFEVVTENDFDVPSDVRQVLANDKCVFILERKKSDVVDDSMDLMFAEQKRFMNLLRDARNFPEFPVNLSSKEGQKIVKGIAYDGMHELFEAIQLLTDAKDHKQSLTGDFNKEKFLEEMSDAFHYMIEICIMCDISSDDLYRAYMKKGTLNFARILGGY